MPKNMQSNLVETFLGILFSLGQSVESISHAISSNAMFQWLFKYVDYVIYDFIITSVIHLVEELWTINLTTWSTFHMLNIFRINFNYNWLEYSQKNNFLTITITWMDNEIHPCQLANFKCIIHLGWRVFYKTL